MGAGQDGGSKQEGNCYWNNAKRETVDNYIYSLRPISLFYFLVFLFFSVPSFPLCLALVSTR